VATIARAGYHAVEETPNQRVIAEITLPWWRDGRLRWVLLAALLWALASVLPLLGGDGSLMTALFAAAIVSGGWPFARAGWQAVRARRLDMNALMTISALGAALLGQWGEGAAVVVLFALGGALQA